MYFHRESIVCIRVGIARYPFLFLAVLSGLLSRGIVKRTMCYARVGLVVNEESGNMDRTSTTSSTPVSVHLPKFKFKSSGSGVFGGGQSGTIHTSVPAQAQANLRLRILLLLSLPLPEFHSPLSCCFSHSQTQISATSTFCHWSLHIRIHIQESVWPSQLSLSASFLSTPGRSSTAPTPYSPHLTHTRQHAFNLLCCVLPYTPQPAARHRAMEGLARGCP